MHHMSAINTGTKHSKIVSHIIKQKIELPTQLFSWLIPHLSKKKKKSFQAVLKIKTKHQIKECSIQIGAVQAGFDLLNCRADKSVDISHGFHVQMVTCQQNLKSQSEKRTRHDCRGAARPVVVDAATIGGDYDSRRKDRHFQGLLIAAYSHPESLEVDRRISYQ